MLQLGKEHDTDQPPLPSDAALEISIGRARSYLEKLDHVESRIARAELIARALISVFDSYYARSREIPFAYKRLFEERNWPETFPLSRERLTIYGRYLNAIVALLNEHWPSNIPDEKRFLGGDRGGVSRLLFIAATKQILPSLS